VQNTVKIVKNVRGEIVVHVSSQLRRRGRVAGGGRRVVAPRYEMLF